MTRLLAFIRHVYSGYTHNGGALMAAAISYYALLSIIPLTLLAASLYGLLLHLGSFSLQLTPAGIHKTVEDLQRVIPGNSTEIAALLTGIMGNWSHVGPVGLAILLWTGSQVFHVLENALNHTWGVTQARPFWKGRLIALGLMVLGGLLLIASVIIQVLTQWVRARHIPGTESTLANIPLVWGAMAYVAPLIFSFNAFTLIYRIVPYARVTWIQAMVGAAFSSVLWDAAKVSFGWYLNEFGARGYNRLYGSLGGLVLVVLWVYYTANILVLGGEVAYAWATWKEAPAREKRPRSRRPRLSRAQRRAGRDLDISPHTDTGHD